MREPDHSLDDIEWQKVVGHREAGQHDKRHRALGRDRIPKRAEPAAVDKPRSDMAGGPHHRGMAVACRHSDHDIARFDQGQMRRHRRAGQAIEHSDIIGFLRAA